MAFEGFIELLSGLLGLDHRFTHTRLVALCLSYLCPSNRRSPKPFTIDDDVETGAAEILKTTDRLRLRRLFLGDESPLLLLETKPVRDLVGLTDQCFDTLSQFIITRFHIGKEALATLQNRIENLVQSSVPYIESVSSFKPLATAQSPNFLFCHDPEAARSLADLTESFLATARYTSAPSPLDHFVIFYQEVPGLALSDLAI